MLFVNANFMESYWIDNACVSSVDCECLRITILDQTGAFYQNTQKNAKQKQFWGPTGLLSATRHENDSTASGNSI